MNMRVGATLCVIAVLGACASAQKPEPERASTIPGEQIRSSLRVVAVAPPEFPPDLEDPDPVSRDLAALVEGQLREAGLAVVPAHEVAAA